MKNLHSLVNLIKRLSNDELKTLNNFLNFQQRNGHSKSKQLVHLIDKEKETNPSILQIKIYGKSNGTAFNKLIDRLYYKLLETLTFDSGIDNYPERTRVIF